MMILDESLFIEMSEQDILEEARKKKRKNKKNKLSFKGFGWWPIYLDDDEDRNCGNMEYNNAMFNKMMGSADYSSDVGGDIGASDAGAGEGVGTGMGESLIKETIIKMMPRVKEFIITYSNLIQDEDWDELFDAHACNPDWPELDEDEVRNLVAILNDTCDADLDVEGILAGV